MDIYSLENAIRSFFDKDASPNQKECDDLAISLLEESPIVPSKIHGQFSYTVFSPQATTDVCSEREGSNLPVTNAKIVQFRLNNSKIDIYVAQLAKAIHGDIAPKTDYHGEIGQEAVTYRAGELFEEDESGGGLEAIGIDQGYCQVRKIKTFI